MSLIEIKKYLSDLGFKKHGKNYLIDLPHGFLLVVTPEKQKNYTIISKDGSCHYGTGYDYFTVCINIYHAVSLKTWFNGMPVEGLLSISDFLDIDERKLVCDNGHVMNYLKEQFADQIYKPLCVNNDLYSFFLNPKFKEAFSRFSKEIEYLMVYYYYCDCIPEFLNIIEDTVSALIDHYPYNIPSDISLLDRINCINDLDIKDSDRLLLSIIKELYLKKMNY